MSTQEQGIEASWRVNARAWTAAVREGRIASRLLATDRAILDALREVGAARVLDIGCGEGWLCRTLAANDVACTGFDAAGALIEAATKLHDGDYRVLTYQAFAAEPACAGGPYDAAVCNFSLLGQDIGPVLRAAAAVLAPGGVLLLQTLHPFADTDPVIGYVDGWRLEDFAAFGEEFASPMPWYFRTVGSWIREVTAAGFELLECREPLHPQTARPLSLLLCARTRAHSAVASPDSVP